MNEHKRLTNDELNDFLQRAVVQLCPELTQQLLSLGSELAQYREKIENGTLVELPCMIQNNDGEWRVYFFNTMVYEIDCYKYDDIDKEDAEATLKELKGEV